MESKRMLLPYPPSYDNRILQSLVDSDHPGKWSPFGNAVWKMLCSKSRPLKHLLWRGSREAFVKRIFPYWQKMPVRLDLRPCDKIYLKRIAQLKQEKKQRGTDIDSTTDLDLTVDRAPLAETKDLNVHTKENDWHISELKNTEFYEDYSEYLRNRNVVEFQTRSSEDLSELEDTDENALLLTLLQQIKNK